jgi:hypothetical protein
VIAWSAIGGAVLIGIVILGFCVYELSWKAQRLRRDLSGLSRLSNELQTTQRDLMLLRDRLRTTSLRDR